jgi:DNA primase
MDCLVAWSAKIPAVSSTGGALSFQKEWAEYFKDKEVLICFDNDESGGNGMVKTLSFIPHAKLIFLPDAPNIKDISDYVTHGGDLEKLMGTAKHFTSEEDVIEDRSSRIALFKSTHFHDAWIEENKPKETAPIRRSGEVFSSKLERAKAYPINELIQFKGKSARCLWHEEKTPSLYYYAKTNSCYCFGGCGKSYDAVDTYMKINNCSFKEAVEKLQ